MMPNEAIIILEMGFVILSRRIMDLFAFNMTRPDADKH